MRNLGLCALVSVLAVTGCNGLSLSSRWRDRDILIDGDATEWYNATTYLKSEKVSLGVMNDDAHLYLLLTSADRAAQMQVLARGFTVWFEPEGGKSKGLGIRFPVGMRERLRERDGGGAGRRGGPPPGDGEGGRTGRNGMGRMGRDLPDVETLLADLDRGDPPVEILAGDETRRSTVAQETDLGLALRAVNGVLIYELKVPLGEGPDAVNAGPGDVLSVKLETARVERDMPEGRGPNGGFGGGGGRGGPVGGGPPGGGMPQMGAPSGMPEPIDATATVTLAVRP